MASDFRKDASTRNDEDRRKELAEFLRTRRARVPPSEAGALPASRRRTPGLRREEVAERAGVSASWYTWLEQGRDIHPSAGFLVRLGDVLRLSPLETHHLFTLAGKAPPESLETRQEEVPEALEKLVREVLPIPAFVMGERFDFLLWNRHFERQIYNLNQIPRERRTWLDLLFVESEIHRRRSDWQEDARRAVAEFRWSVGKHVGSPWVKELITRLRQESPEFAQIWRLHDIQERKKSRVLEIPHEENGNRSFIRSIYIPIEAENLRLVTFTPLPGARRRKTR